MMGLFAKLIDEDRHCYKKGGGLGQYRCIIYTCVVLDCFLPFFHLSFIFGRLYLLRII